MTKEDKDGIIVKLFPQRDNLEKQRLSRGSNNEAGGILARGKRSEAELVAT